FMWVDCTCFPDVKRDVCEACRTLVACHSATPDVVPYPTRRASDLPRGAEGCRRCSGWHARRRSDWATPVGPSGCCATRWPKRPIDRKSTRLNSSHVKDSYAVFCLKEKRRR